MSPLKVSSTRSTRGSLFKKFVYCCIDFQFSLLAIIMINQQHTNDSWKLSAGSFFFFFLIKIMALPLLCGRACISVNQQQPVVRKIAPMFAALEIDVCPQLILKLIKGIKLCWNHIAISCETNNGKEKARQ